MAGVVVVAGVSGSIAAAHQVARSDSQASYRSLATSSNGIASALQLALLHEQDLAISAGAFEVGSPDATQAQFLAWTGSVAAMHRYPELLAIGEIALVPAAQLGSFASREASDPPGTLATGSGYQVVPPGARPYYCLATGAAPRSAAQNGPAAADYCAGSLGPRLLAARDSGQGAYLPYVVGGEAELAVGVPIYRTGVVPTTMAARRASFVGWTGLQIRPDVVVAAARRGHPGTAVIFHFGTGSGAARFTSGAIPAGAASTSVNLHNGWTVQTFGSITGAGLAVNRNALLLLIGGIAFSVLIATLFYVLGTSRARAVVLVQERTDQLEHQAFHDELTGLPNRALILDRIDQMMARSRRDGTPIATLFLDLDDFKDINDTLGHRAGDQLLIEVAARLSRHLREGDTVGRLGGDEFVILVEGGALAHGGRGVAERVLREVGSPFEIAGSDVPLKVTVSIGVAEGTRLTAEDLLRDADIALYRAKAAGKRCAAIFSSSMQEEVEDHRSLQIDLGRALEEGQLFLQYQPTVDLATGIINGVEALLRWRHPTRGVVQPDQFIPAMEASGLIVPVGRWVLETACRQGALWGREGYPISVSVNVSGRQLERDRIVDHVYAALSDTGLDPCLLILELTETALMSDVGETIARLELLKAVGVRIAIDDFGTGYSSIAYLHQFPIDILKIDRSFVSKISDTPESAAIVHTLVQLSKVLGLETVAEGIETEEQRLRLRAEAVDSGQGFLFARPLDVDGVDRMLAAVPVPQRR